MYIIYVHAQDPAKINNNHYFPQRPSLSYHSLRIKALILAFQLFLFNANTIHPKPCSSSFLLHTYYRKFHKSHLKFKYYFTLICFPQRPGLYYWSLISISINLKYMHTHTHTWELYPTFKPCNIINAIHVAIVNRGSTDHG